MDIVIHDDDLLAMYGSINPDYYNKKYMLEMLANNLATKMNGEAQRLIENSKMKRNTTENYEKIRKWFPLFLKTFLELT